MKQGQVLTIMWKAWRTLTLSSTVTWSSATSPWRFFTETFIFWCCWRIHQWKQNTLGKGRRDLTNKLLCGAEKSYQTYCIKRNIQKVYNNILKNTERSKKRVATMFVTNNSIWSSMKPLVKSRYPNEALLLCTAWLLYYNRRTTALSKLQWRNNEFPFTRSQECVSGETTSRSNICRCGRSYHEGSGTLPHKLTCTTSQWATTCTSPGPDVGVEGFDIQTMTILLLTTSSRKYTKSGI